ncbi:MAG: hypothetical protein C0404_10115 [Verrucomicrobia bacterium]|nr:hypothetical protein [Verrucomicrobiota bacterium]
MSEYDVIGGRLEEFGAYRKALELFDLVVDDMEQIRSLRCLERLVGQQFDSADSVCANIEEGYGRESAAEYRRFLIISRGSLRETCGRYRRMRHWPPKELIEKRLVLGGEINRILTSTTSTLGRRK